MSLSAVNAPEHRYKLYNGLRAAHAAIAALLEPEASPAAQNAVANAQSPGMGTVEPDTARLDWLNRIWPNVNFKKMAEWDDIREAIDAAMESATGTVDGGGA